MNYLPTVSVKLKIEMHVYKSLRIQVLPQTAADTVVYVSPVSFPS